MSPLAVFFHTLSRSSAICIGIGLVIVNPPFDVIGPLFFGK